MNPVNSSSKLFIPLLGTPYCTPDSLQIIEAEEYGSTFLKVLSPDSYKNQWPLVDKRSFILCPESMRFFESSDQINNLIQSFKSSIKLEKSIINNTAVSRKESLDNLIGSIKNVSLKAKSPDEMDKDQLCTWFSSKPVINEVPKNNPILFTEMPVEIMAMIPKMEFPKTPREHREKIKSIEENINILRSMLLNSSDPVKHLIFNEIISSKSAQIIFHHLLDYDCINFDKERESMLEIFKDPKFQQLPSDLARYEKRLKECKTQVFQRKITWEGLRGGNVTEKKLLTPLYKDEEILKISKIEKEIFLKKIKGFCTIALSENKKTVIQQIAFRGCGPTCVAMLLMDWGIPPNISQLWEASLTNANARKGLIEQHPGLKELRTELINENKTEFLKKLQIHLQNNGSAIVGIDGQIEAHCIICDEIASDLSTIRVRDPWHGWEITLDSNAFLDSVWSKDPQSVYYKKYRTTIQQIISFEASP